MLVVRFQARPEMEFEPLAGEARHRFEGAGLLEQGRRPRHDDEPFFTP
jgi:hypothetical protein